MDVRLGAGNENIFVRRGLLPADAPAIDSNGVSDSRRSPAGRSRFSLGTTRNDVEKIPCVGRRD